jgi:hypothetical protein
MHGGGAAGTVSFPATFAVCDPIFLIGDQLLRWRGHRSQPQRLARGREGGAQSRCIWDQSAGFSERMRSVPI